MLGTIELERRPHVSDRHPADDATGGSVHGRHGAMAATRATPAEAAELFDSYHERVRRYVAFRVRDPADAEDIASDVFRRVVSSPIPVDPGSRPAWLFRVAHNAIVDHYRRRRFTIPLLDIIERPDDAPSLPERAIHDEEMRTIDRALAALVGRQRAAIYLRFYEDLEYADIAQVMGVPAVTARTLVHRGLRKVGAQLAPLRSADGGAR